MSSAGFDEIALFSGFATLTRHRAVLTPAFEQLFEELIESDGDGHSEIRRRTSDNFQSAALWSINPVPQAEVGDSANRSPYTPDAFAPDSLLSQRELPTDAESIASELGLKPGLTARQLKMIRRNFARGNHPDGFPAELQDNATQRMMVANALCDAYTLKQSKL